MTLAKGVIIFKVWVYRLPWGLFLNWRLENFISQIVHSNCLFNYVQLFVWVFAGALGGQQGGQIGSSGAGVVGQHLWEQENEPPSLARAISALNLWIITSSAPGCHCLVRDFSLEKVRYLINWFWGMNVCLSWCPDQDLSWSLYQYNLNIKVKLLNIACKVCNQVFPVYKH